MKRVTAVAAILGLALATSHLGWPCACAHDAEAADAPVAHGCCPTAAAAVEGPLTERRLEAACAPGCCDAPATITALAAERALTWHAAPPLAFAPPPAAARAADPGHRAVADGVDAPRGPPDPLATRLALLQTWRC